MKNLKKMSKSDDISLEIFSGETGSSRLLT